VRLEQAITGADHVDDERIVLDLRACRVKHRLAQSHGLEDRAHGVDVAGQTRVDGGHPRAPLGQQGDETLPGQAPQRFSGGRG